MRYYVLLSGLVEGQPYVVAETVRDPHEEDPALSLAGGLGGALAEVLTESELLDAPGGEEALAAWRDRDDTGYDDHEEYLEGLAGAGTAPATFPGLRLILSPVPEPG